MKIKFTKPFMIFVASLGVSLFLFRPEMTPDCHFGNTHIGPTVLWTIPLADQAVVCNFHGCNNGPTGEMKFAYYLVCK